MVDPSTLPKLEIEHVYGYRCYDGIRQNLHYNTKGQAVYNTAGLGIIMDTTTR
jgi:ribosomal protein S13